MITRDQLIQILPGSAWRADRFVDPLNQTMAQYEINTVQRQAAFIAQVGVESGQLRYIRELWGPTPMQRSYEPPSSMATELGNTEVGDGYKFRGRGLIQITGRYNYEQAGRELGQPFVDQPELVEEPLWASMVSGWFWDKRHLNLLADEDTQEAFDKITKKINGGMLGATERTQYWLSAKEILEG